MTEGIDVSQLIADYRDPDPLDPYTFGGVSRAPEYYDRVFRTPDDVIAHLAQAKITRHMDDDAVLAASGISRDALARLTAQGKGNLHDFLAVTEALGVRAVCIPTSIIFGA